MVQTLLLMETELIFLVVIGHEEHHKWLISKISASMIHMDLRYFTSFDEYKTNLKKNYINHSCACDVNHASVIAKSENE